MKTGTVTAIRIGRTFNLGNYESERVDVEVTIDPGESFDDAVARARELVQSARSRPVDVEIVDDAASDDDRFDERTGARARRRDLDSPRALGRGGR